MTSLRRASVSIFQVTEPSYELDGKAVVDFDESYTLPLIKQFLYNAYLESSPVWLTTVVDNVLAVPERVWICRFEWDTDSFCIINPLGKKWCEGCPKGVIMVDVNSHTCVRVGLVWSQVERHLMMFRCSFLGSDLSKDANYPGDKQIFRFNGLRDPLGNIMDPHFDNCRIPAYEKSWQKIGDWAPDGNFNYDIRRNSDIYTENGGCIPNNCNMGVFEQLKTAGYIAFSHFNRFCKECEVPLDILKIPISSLEMAPTECKKPFAGCVEVVDCKSVLEWQQATREGRTRRVTLELRCVSPVVDDSVRPSTPNGSTGSRGLRLCHVAFVMVYTASDTNKRVLIKGHILVDSGPELSLRTRSVDSFIYG